MRYSIQDPPPCTSLQSTFPHASCTLVLLGTAKPSIYSNHQSMEESFQGASGHACSPAQSADVQKRHWLAGETGEHSQEEA